MKREGADVACCVNQGLVQEPIFGPRVGALTKRKQHKVQEGWHLTDQLTDAAPRSLDLGNSANPQSISSIVLQSDRYSLPRTLFRRFVHWASHWFILSSRRTRRTQIGDLSIEVPPSVFHPGVFVTSKMFAAFLRDRDFSGKRVVEVGTGSGILAISAARAGARHVVALDINPGAVKAARMNADRNGVGQRLESRLSNLFAAVRADERFDVIISSPPSFAGEPCDMADHAWFAGPGYSHLRDLFRAAMAHLTDGGEMLLLSSDSNIALLKEWGDEAGFTWETVAEKSILVEMFIIFRLTPRALETSATLRAGAIAGLDR
jgi:release factor glutamine methyltransferase